MCTFYFCVLSFNNIGSTCPNIPLREREPSWEQTIVWCCWIFVDFLNARREVVIFNTDKRSLFLNNIWSIVQVCLAIEYFSKRPFVHTTTEMFNVRRTARYLCKFLLECQRGKEELHHVEGCLISGSVVIKFAL